MHARSCQLCGKPLSRLRVGNDGDFCSKEHRSQFRLRAGMDRLLEVNKVASLMRRREAARQIPPSVLLCNSATTRHGYLDPRPPGIDSLPRLSPLRLSISGLGGVGSPGGRFVPQRMEPASASAPQPRSHSGDVLFSVRDVRPSIAQPERRVVLAFPQTPAAAFQSLAAGAGTHRDFQSLLPRIVRTPLAGSPVAFRRSRAMEFAPASKLRAFPTHPMEGNAFRVSIGMAFRAAAVREIPRRPEVAKTAGFPHIVRPGRLRGRNLAGAGPRAVEVPMPEVAPRLPELPGPSRLPGLHSRSAMLLNGKLSRGSSALDRRPSILAWRSNEPHFRPTGPSQAESGFLRRNASHPSRVEVRLHTVGAFPKVARAPFVTRDELFVPKVPYCNVLAAATPATHEDPPPPLAPPPPQPVLVRPPAIVKYEEHFDAGWDNWIGNVADWKVDVAGVRTGSLALYLPTLDMADYDLEFLARLEARTVIWVVRAESKDTYLRCTLTALEGGQLEFSRALVRRGVAEAPVISSQRASGKPRTAMTVRMSVAGPVFSVSVDGNTIDSWVDDRLAAGGAGFMGAADDRARIYWVRVSSSAAQSKEYTFQ